ncbi:MAG: preprotein translocase subunit SecE [Actinomycetes bacterium]
MNRETKRMMQRQGQAGPDGTPGTRRAPAQPAARKPKSERTSIRQFFREVREEMRQVAWPTRTELINYTSITLFVLIVMIALIFGLNLGFGKIVLFLFKK